MLRAVGRNRHKTSEKDDHIHHIIPTSKIILYMGLVGDNLGEAIKLQGQTR